MAFKLSEKACHDIARGDYTLAYNDHLKALHLRLEDTRNERDHYLLQGQIYQLRQQMGLKAKALAQIG